MEKYICSIDVKDVLDRVIKYWDLDINNSTIWYFINNNIAYTLINNEQLTVCVYTYPQENARVNYIYKDVIKSAWINSNTMNRYYLTEREIKTNK